MVNIQANNLRREEQEIKRKQKVEGRSKPWNCSNSLKTKDIGDQKKELFQQIE